MTIEMILNKRSGAKCELCGSQDNLSVYDVPRDSSSETDAQSSILVCSICQDQINSPDKMDVNHWRCLNDSMWSQTPVVQVMAWRMLTRLQAEGWPQDLLDMLYLDDETQAWAELSGEGKTEEETSIKHKDSNGVILEAGDTVLIIKDLNVKGTSFTAKRGTAVRGISLVADNPKQIEGRVNGQQIVILTQFVKKS